ncbi:MAG: tRNA 4-thiouridine(8) synthase ThiI [bacterium]
MISSRKANAVGLFSGSLDSILATKLVVEQKVNVVALHFRVPFAVSRRFPNEKQLQSLADLFGVSLVSVEVGDDYLDIVRVPQFGYIRRMAPCVDCRLYMLKKAKELMEEIKADFVFTGEVLGQQPFSQNKRSLKLLEKTAELNGRLLRPLSAKLLEPTIPELTGLLRRERFFDFHGKKRRRQIRLAREFGLVDYPIPGGGCLLTDSNFAARCRDAIEYNELTLPEVELLGYGRHFRLPSGGKVVVGRNKKENEVLERLGLAYGLMVCKAIDIVGPVVLYRARKRTKKDIETAARICARYSDAPDGQTVKVICADQEFSVSAASDEQLKDWRVAWDPDGAITEDALESNERRTNESRDKRAN